MLDLNVVSGIFIAIVLVLLVRFVFPLYKDRGTIYKDVKAGLMLFGYAFREEKVKAITDILFNVVSIIEQYDKPNIDKQYEAMEKAQKALLEEFDIVLDDRLMELIVDIAVAYLPATKQAEIE